MNDYPNVTLIEPRALARELTGLWFFPFAKTYHKRLNRARDIFYPGVALIPTIG